MQFVRFEAAVPNARGRHPGIFALANGLAHSGRLSDAERHWWRGANEWFDRACPDPAAVDPSLFDRAVHPVVSCWFTPSARLLLDRVPEYLDLLDRHGVAWVQRTSDDPGARLYEDAMQIVVAPRVHRSGSRVGGCG